MRNAHLGHSSSLSPALASSSVLNTLIFSYPFTPDARLALTMFSACVVLTSTRATTLSLGPSFRSSRSE